VQIQNDVWFSREVRRDGALDRSAVRHAARARNVERDARAILARHTETAHDETALPDRIDLAVDAAQWRHQKTAAAQAAGVADRVDGDVDRLTGLRECRQVSTHRHRSDGL